MNVQNVFGVADYVVFSLMLAISALVGVYFYFTGGRQKTTDEILLGDKKMSIAPVAFSLMASFASAIGMLGLSAENYLYGFHIVLLVIGSVIGTPIVVYVYHPVFYNMQITTAYEYLNRRFGKVARFAGSVVFMLHMILYMAVVLYAPALAMSAVTGISKWASILSVGVVCTFYCTLGGIKAVLWTDLIQALIMYATLFAVIIKGCIDAGGLTNTWKIATEGRRMEFLPLEFDITVRYSFWSTIIGGLGFHVATNAVNQTQVQRMMTVKNISQSRKAIYVSLPLKIILVACICFSGIVMYANLGSCDPLLLKEQSGLTSSDQLLPYFIMVSLGHLPGLPGLCVAGLFSAAISTLSSAVNSLSAVVLEDFIRPYCCTGKLTESKAALITKLLTLFFGALCIALSYVVDQLGGLMQASITIFGVLGGPMLGIFTLGMLFVRPNQKGAIMGLLTSLGVFMWISFASRYYGVKATPLPISTEGCPVTGNTTVLSLSGLLSNETSTLTPYIEEEYIFPLYKISYLWYSVLGTILTVVVGYIFSLLTGPNQYVDPELISPVAVWARAKKCENFDKTVNIYHLETIEDNKSKEMKEKYSLNENGSTVPVDRTRPTLC